MYGLEMIEKSGGTLKRGTIYVYLAKMEDKGFAESRLEPQGPEAIGPPRRTYVIKGLGERVLALKDAERQAAAKLRLAWAGGDI